MRDARREGEDRERLGARGAHRHRSRERPSGGRRGGLGNGPPPRPLVLPSSSTSTGATPPASSRLWGPDDDVVVVDAVVSGDPPGTIVEIDALAAPLPADVSWATTHGAGVAEGIELARVLGMLPKSLVLIGISAKEFELERR